MLVKQEIMIPENLLVMLSTLIQVPSVGIQNYNNAKPYQRQKVNIMQLLNVQKSGYG